MNEQSWHELEWLKRRHSGLERELSELASRLTSLEERLKSQAASSMGAAAGAERLRAQTPENPLAPRGEVPQDSARPEVPHWRGQGWERHEEEVLQDSTKFDIPPIITQVKLPSQGGLTGTEQSVVASAESQLAVPESARRSTTLEAEQATIGSKGRGAGNGSSAASIEMRLGTYWLVRVGIVMVLTALVFFGNLAYQNFISQMGPGGKVALLYLASFSLMGAGFWFQRRQGREAVKNYGQVLLAGGLAAVYFTTYAAHHFSNLRVIASPLADGVLLMAWAGFMFWLADRKRSEVLALFAVGLAYYTSVITRVGHFTLYSNLVLAATAGFFLLRHSWVRLTIASLPATYGSYAYWRFFDGRGWNLPSAEQGLWAGAWFLFCYWVLFTIAGFRSRQADLSGKNRAFFLTANNAALFCMFLMTMLQVREGGLWRFLAVYGTVLLGLSVASRKWLPQETMVREAYLSQGLLLVTAALVARLSGMQLALVLGLESTLLLLQSRFGANRILRIGSWITALMATAWGLEGLRDFHQPTLWLGIGLGALMTFNAFTSKRRTSLKLGDWFESEVGGFSLLALAVWFGAVWHNVTPEHLGPVLVGLALILTFSVYGLRLPELSILAQAYAGLGLLIFLGRLPALSVSPPVWQHLLMLAGTLVLVHWWPRQDRIAAGKGAVALETFYSLAVVALLFGCFSPRLDSVGWVWVGSVLVVGCTTYAVFTRAWILALASQLFLVTAGVSFLRALEEGQPGWHLALILVLALAGLGNASRWWLAAREDIGDPIRQPVLYLARAYRWVAVLMAIAWVCRCGGDNTRVLLLALAGAAFFGPSGWRRDPDWRYFGGLCWIPVLAFFFIPELGTPRLSWAHPLAVFLFLSQQRIARRWPEPHVLDPRLHHLMIVIGGVCFWTFVSRFVLTQAAGFYLTASWSGVAVVLFALGMVFRERAYRYLGLAVLGCALGRVIVFDVWKLETLFRMLSFLAIGIALLALGFVYNRFQDKIKQWL